MSAWPKMIRSNVIGETVFIFRSWKTEMRKCQHEKNLKPHHRLAIFHQPNIMKPYICIMSYLTRAK